MHSDKSWRIASGLAAFFLGFIFFASVGIYVSRAAEMGSAAFVLSFTLMAGLLLRSWAKAHKLK
jgi:hypothetical protein